METMAGVSITNQRKGLQAAYIVTSASSEIQPPTFRAAPKVGARKPGQQRDEGGAEVERGQLEP